MTKEPTGPAVNAEAKKKADLSLVDQAVADADLQAMTVIARRAIEERTTLAAAFTSIVTGWSLMGGEKAQPDTDAMFAIERVATEAIAFAREVVQALTKAK